MTAATTEYSTLYKNDYFAHKPGSSSFDQKTLPAILGEFCRSIGTGIVLDVGAGNGLLGDLLSEIGVESFGVDIMERSAPNFFQANLGSANSDLVPQLRQARENYHDGPHLLTCFDVAEHIDIEHIADFAYNLGLLIDQFGIISISTRPSSQANLFHCTILPIDTWKYMFGLLGLRVSIFEPLQACRSFQQFHSDTRELFAVSYWQKRNLFRDDGAHQHYLLLEKENEVTVDRQIFRARMSEALDIQYRRLKRESVAGRDLPNLVYHLSFVQDWPFLRSLLDIWPVERTYVIIRRDLIAPAYRELIESLLQRFNIPVASVDTILEAERALEKWALPLSSLFVTATEGLPTVVHGLGSFVALAARRRGLTTVCLQHGHMVPERLAMGSQFFGAMDFETARQMEEASTATKTCKAVALGSPKHLDSACGDIDPDAISFRLGSYANRYRKHILVGSNLHWGAHQTEQSSTLKWLEAALDRYPDFLFIWRPHPDDQAALSGLGTSMRSNLMLIDEAILLSIDWPISRILRAVDIVISTHSTLIEDAIAVDKAVALLSTSITDPRSITVEERWSERGVVIIDGAQLAAGCIPEALIERKSFEELDSPSINPSFFVDLCALVTQSDSDDLTTQAEFIVEKAFVEDCKNLSMDSHPHTNRENLKKKLREFVVQ